MRDFSKDLVKIVSFEFSKGLKYSLTSKHCPHLQREPFKGSLRIRTNFCVIFLLAWKGQRSTVGFHMTSQWSSWAERSQPHLVSTKSLTFND